MYSKSTSVTPRPSPWWMMLKCLGRKGHYWKRVCPEEVQHYPTVLADTLHSSALCILILSASMCCNQTHTYANRSLQNNLPNGPNNALIVTYCQWKLKVRDVVSLDQKPKVHINLKWQMRVLPELVSKKSVINL